MSLGVRALAALPLVLAAACGARSSLSLAGATGAGGASIASSTTAMVGVTAGTGGSAPDCRLDDLSTWHAERYRDQGDYERVAVALSGVPWVALKENHGNIVLVELGLDTAQGIVQKQRVDLAGSPVYPIAFDLDDKRFVLLTATGINFNGDLELWRVDRQSGAVLRLPLGDPPKDPAFTVGSTVGLVGDNVVVAYGRFAEMNGTIELRDDALGVVQSMTTPDPSFIGVHSGSAAVDVYVGATAMVHVENGAMTPMPVEPSWQVIGGLDGFLVELGDKFRLRQGDAIWSGPWPHTQVSPPAVVRLGGTEAVFSLETELTAVVGHRNGNALDWLAIEPAPGATGVGVGLFPVSEPGRLGLFYLGLEIPSPEQPLRYYGLRCDAKL